MVNRIFMVTLVIIIDDSNGGHAQHNGHGNSDSDDGKNDGNE